MYLYGSNYSNCKKASTLNINAFSLFEINIAKKEDEELKHGSSLVRR